MHGWHNLITVAGAATTQLQADLQWRKHHGSGKHLEKRGDKYHHKHKYYKDRYEYNEPYGDGSYEYRSNPYYPEYHKVGAWVYSLFAGLFRSWVP
jgi:hypothetical protein